MFCSIVSVCLGPPLGTSYVGATKTLAPLDMWWNLACSLWFLLRNILWSYRLHSQQGISVNPRFGTNSFLERGLPDLDFFWHLPITEWGSLFWNGDPISEWFQIGDSFPKSLICNGNYSRTVSDWTVPVSETGMLSLPVLKWGSPFWNGIANGYVPIMKRGSPFQYGEYWQPRSEMGIMPCFWLLVVRDPKDRKRYSPRSETGSPHSVMGRRQKKFQIGESPF